MEERRGGNAKKGLFPLSLSFFAVIISVLVYAKTMPKERPVITASNAKINYNLQGDTLNIDMVLLFKNIGLHPATEIKLEIAGGVQDYAKSFKNVLNQSIANMVGEENAFGFTQNMELTAVGAKDGKPVFKENKAIFVIRIQYRDMYSFLGYHNRYHEDFWITYKVGDSIASHATLEEVDSNKTFLLKHVSQIEKAPVVKLIDRIFR